jgi:inosine kinase
MRFPGSRKTKHYFPVNDGGRVPFEIDLMKKGNTYIVGIDQLLVDIEVHVNDEFLESHGIKKGESFILEDSKVESIYNELKDKNQIIGEYAGGSIGNTLHNYSTLSDDKSIALGTICENITVGSYGFKYICNTSSKVDFSYLQPCKGAMARAICFLTEDKERTFGIGKGIMNDLTPEFIPTKVIQSSKSLLVSAYLLRDHNSSMFAATMKAVKAACEANVPVVFSLGTSHLIESDREFFQSFIKDYVTVVAMNEEEAEALVGTSDALLAGEKILEFADLVLLTVGKKGLYLCSYVDEEEARETKDKIHSKSISEYNKFEYSRAMIKSNCTNPIKIYTHINPYMGGPGEIKNTNGAGDAALAAVLHDIAANSYHGETVPNSPKNAKKFLTYSSIHQVSKYANRVSFEVLNQNSPRLSRGLPQREENLEETYWDL